MCYGLDYSAVPSLGVKECAVKNPTIFHPGSLSLFCQSEYIVKDGERERAVVLKTT